MIWPVNSTLKSRALGTFDASCVYAYFPTGLSDSVVGKQRKQTAIGCRVKDWDRQFICGLYLPLYHNFQGEKKNIYIAP